jgi:hypothetical protein
MLIGVAAMLVSERALNAGFIRAENKKDAWFARTNRAFVRAVAGFAAFFAHRSLHSRAFVSVVALWFERAFAIAALVLRRREAQSAFVGRAAAFAAPLHSRQSFRLWPFGSSVPWQLLHLCSGHATLKALLWVVLPHSLHGVHPDAECPDAPHLLHTRNLQLADFCLCPGCLHSVQ